MEFRGFTLDTFQEEAITALLNDSSVVVSAATGTGKTLIADYMINEAIKNNQKVFYTAPIKALSNQKYHDFCDAHGKSKVGLLTGDVVINPEAQIIVMTTEIYRNMLLEGSSDLDNLKFVVFDEIHYINDIERGTVWEESIIFSPDYVRFICLSATIPNYKQFAAWIESISGHKVSTVSYMKRAVPLEHYVYEFKTGLTTAQKLKSDMKRFDNVPDYYRVRGKRKRHKKVREKVATHIDIVRELKQKEWMPAIYFVFSRKGTLQRAQQLAQKFDFCTPQEKAQIVSYVREHITADISHMPSVRAIRELLPKGIGVHNAGLLPQMKSIVEHLFNEGLLKVLYTTETFAVGINMPAKTVCFDSIEKYDGVSFRYLNTKEYFQLAGRAGRRGIDKVGRSIVLVDRNQADMDKVVSTTEKDIDPIISQFKLSYNTVLNLIKSYNDERTIEIILKSNFGYFVKKQSKQQVRITTSFQNYKRTLTKLGHIENGELTQKGIFTANVYTEELSMAELIFDNIIQNVSNQHFILLIATLIYEGRRADHFEIFKENNKPVFKLLDRVEENRILARKIKKLNMKKLYGIVDLWSSGKAFEDLLEICNLPEGDIIRLFRQVIDVLRQIKGGLVASGYDPELRQRIDECLKAIDRDIISTVV